MLPRQRCNYCAAMKKQESGSIRVMKSTTNEFNHSAGGVVFDHNNGSANADYYYGIDNFGNIIYIYDANGNIVVTYKYDAWGKAISTTGSLASTIGTINPYRYKSYYYDEDKYFL